MQLFEVGHLHIRPVSENNKAAQAELFLAGLITGFKGNQPQVDDLNTSQTGKYIYLRGYIQGALHASYFIEPTGGFG